MTTGIRVPRAGTRAAAMSVAVLVVLAACSSKTSSSTATTSPGTSSPAGASASTGASSAAATSSAPTAAPSSSAPASAAAPTGAPINLGVSAAQTGYLSGSSDIPFLRGIRDAVQAINAEGGVNGRPLKLASVLDEQSVAATGVANVNKLLNETHVDVVMAGSDSTACASVQSAITAAQVPMTCISPPPAGSSYQFQVAASVPDMVKDMMGFIKSKNITSVALLSVTTVYGQIISKIIQGIAAADGIKIVANVSVPSNATDLTATMQQVKASNPGAVVDSITGPEHVVEAKGAAAAGLAVPVVQITDTTDVFQAGAKAYSQLYFVTLPPQAYPSIPDPALLAADKPFVQLYSTGNGGDVTQIAAAAYGWDAVHILAAAMTSSGATTGDKLRSALEGLTYQGVNSLYKYSATDHSGENTVANPNSIGQFVNDKLQIVYNAS